MRVTKKHKGYTIVETMIALAVSASMIIITLLLISGQIAKQQYRTAVYNTEQALQSVLNDVQLGYLSRESAIPPGTCSGGEGASDCVFAGKRISIDTTAKKINITTLFLENETISPINSPPNVLKSIQTDSIQLPGSVDYYVPSYGGGLSNDIYVLFTRYYGNFGASFAGGAQSVASFIEGSGNKIIPQTASTSVRYVCLSNAPDRRAKISYGMLGSLQVKVDYDPSTGDCPL